MATFRLATGAQNAAANAIGALPDAGAGAGTLKIYTGTVNTDANTDPLGTLLATFTLNTTAFGAAAAGVITANAIASTTGLAAGTAGCFMIEDSVGTNVADGDVTATGGGGTIELSTTTISAGATVSITSFTVTVPSF